ncbi:hypothetical protein PFISCL1PPCAC_25731, partial [Pristionchus fissidentatus]
DKFFEMSLRQLSVVLLSAVALSNAACPSSDWIEYGGTNKCFKFDPEAKMSYKAAVMHCEQMGATLVSVCSFFENQFVRGITRGADTWIEPKTDCDYKNYLAGNEPSPVKECRVITEDWDGQWTSADCETEKHHVICSMKAPLLSNRFFRFRRFFHI